MKDDKKIKLQVLLTEQEKIKLDSHIEQLPYSISMAAFIRQLIAEKIEGSNKA